MKTKVFTTVMVVFLIGVIACGVSPRVLEQATLPASLTPTPQSMPAESGDQNMVVTPAWSVSSSSSLPQQETVEPTAAQLALQTPTPGRKPTAAGLESTSVAEVEGSPLESPSAPSSQQNVLTSTPLPLTGQATKQLTGPSPVPQTPTPGHEPTHADSALTSVIGSILADPANLVGQEVEIIGYYRGWDLLGEVGTGPPVTRSDWVITDSSGAIYVEAQGGTDGALGLNPSSRDDTTTVVRLVGTVQVGRGNQPYIEPHTVKVLTR
jgi:hypothetical protein